MTEPVSRPRVAASFDEESDGRLDPLMLAIGCAVFAAGGLEKELLLEIARARHDRDGRFPAEHELVKLENMPAGYLLTELRKLELSEDLCLRIDDAIKRRNELVHHLLEDPDIVRAFAGIDAIDEVVARVNQLALDCGALAVELHVVAGAGVESATGKSAPELLAILGNVDPGTLGDDRSRRQLEALQALQALGDVDLSLSWLNESDDMSA